MSNELKLERPLVVFDIESTGIMPQRDRIVEIAVLKVFPDGRTQNTVRRLNPEMPIPPGATAVHGITDDDVKECPVFSLIAEKLFNYIDGCDLCGYNITGFDIPMLEAEFKRAGFEFKVDDRKVVDVYNIFCKLYPRTLSAAYKFYCDKDLNDAHAAEADTRATYEVLKAQLDRYPQLKNDMAALADFTSYTRNVDLAGRIVYNDQGVEVFNFGKYKGRSVAEVFKVDTGYYGWMMQGEFPLNTKNVITNIKLRSFNQK